MRKLTDAEQKRLKARWDLVCEREKEQRQKEIDDLNFEAGAHWDDNVRAEREKAGKPCLTIDLISGVVKQVTNQARSARPGIVVTPRGNGASKESAELWQAILRRIETNSNADYAYLWANQHQAKMGRGIWRMLPYYVNDYENGDDEQDVKVAWVDNQHAVYLGPSSEPDGCDRKVAFIVDDMSEEDYAERFPDSEFATTSDRVFQSIGDAPAEWFKKGSRRIAEYFYIETSTRTRHTLTDGSHVWEDMLERGPQQRVSGKYAQGKPKLPKGQNIVRTRKIPSTKVNWMLTNGVEALEETVIPGRYIPIVEIVGERRNIDGKVDCRGMVRGAKDPQRMENYLESTVVETIALGSKSRWLAADDQIADYRDMWATANRKNWDTLIYKALPNVPPPVPVDREPPIQAAVMAAQRSAMQVRSILGYVDVMADEQGSQGNAVSGRAINARKLQQEMQSSDYMDNLGRGIRLTAKILHFMVRELYDAPRLLRIKKLDDKEVEVVTHAGPEQQPEAQQLIQQAQDVKHVLDLSSGDFDFSFSAGKSFQSQRQESVDAMAQLFSAAPELAQIGADIWVKNQDWPGALELADRLKKMNPAAQGDQQNIPPQVQQRLQQLDQFAQVATQHINDLNEIIKGKQLELQSKEKIAADDNLTKIQIARMQLGVQSDIAAMKDHIQRLEMLVGVIHEERMAHQQSAHEAGLEAMRHEHSKAELREGAIHAGMAAEQGHEQTLEQGEQGHAHAIQQLKAKPEPNGRGSGE